MIYVLGFITQAHWLLPMAFCSPFEVVADVEEYLAG